MLVMYFCNVKYNVQLCTNNICTEASVWPPKLTYMCMRIDYQVLHSKIEQLYVLNAIELIPSIRGYCYITFVSFTVPGKIN